MTRQPQGIILGTEQYCTIRSLNVYKIGKYSQMIIMELLQLGGLQLKLAKEWAPLAGIELVNS